MRIRLVLLIALAILIILSLGAFYRTYLSNRSNRRPSSRALLIYHPVKGGDFPIDCCQSR
jgi:uncharacterized membrane protein affecting hemolysin expression